MIQSPLPYLIFIGMLLFRPLPLNAVPLSDYQWQNRPLLLFAPHRHDARLQQTIEQLQRRNCAVEDRDMLLGVIVTTGQSTLDNQHMPVQMANELRTEYQITNKQFAVILIGKDGGEKYRWYEVPAPEDIFALIDGMPMRQNEMQANPTDCDRPSAKP